MIHITDNAAEEIVNQAKEKNHPPLIRIGVRAGGCTGFALFVEWAGQSSEHDLIFENKEAKVVIDPKSYVLLDGSTVDFKSTFMERGFKIESPKATSSCGCGQSVNF